MWRREGAAAWALALCVGFGLAGAACGTDDPEPAENSGGGDNSSNGTSGDNSGNGTSGDNNGPSCSNTCLMGETECLDDRIVLTCTTKADGCRDFGMPRSCGAGKACMAGECMDTGGGNNPQICTSTCQNGDPPTCNAEGATVMCADHNSDGCLNYEDPNPLPCPEGDVCQKGECMPPACEQEPCELGTTQCDDALIQTCQEISGCLVYGPGEECGQGQTCQADECVEVQTCEDECIAGERLCGPGETPRMCEDGDGDGCVEYVDQQPCGDAQECRTGGECVDVETCEDTCVDAPPSCDGNLILVCTDTDGDGCKELDYTVDCDATQQVCDDSSGPAGCVAPMMMTGQVLINEVFYDATGEDVDPTDGDSPTFIELRGPAGMDISGWTIELINGSDGMSYNSATLPQGTVIDAYGFAVITTTIPDGFLSFALPAAGVGVYPELPPYQSGQDAMQNGPENVALLDDQGVRVDAVGYGAFGSGDVFDGEGMPAEDVFSGHSLGRPPGAADTDDNAADFRSYYPTPGLENADLYINEVYVDRPGADGPDSNAMPPVQPETFLEISAPIRGWEDMNLSGYTLRAINGNDGMDYLFTGVNPGIAFDGWGGINENPGSEGLVVVCHIEAVDPVFNVCTVAYDGVDFQNGPDSVVLEYRGRVIDAVAYGDFSGGATSAGEGSAAPLKPSDAGQSLNRWPIADPSKEVDTDDNATDFHLAAPTPGEENDFPATP